jgi:hypothetical protein
MATLAFKKLTLPFGLYALGNHRQTKITSECDNRSSRPK